MNRTLATTAAAGIMAVSALAVATPAHAADNIYFVDGSYSRCLEIQRTYISSWTKVTKSCYAVDRGDLDYAFHWTSIR